MLLSLKKKKESKKLLHNCFTRMIQDLSILKKEHRTWQNNVSLTTSTPFAAPIKTQPVRQAVTFTQF